TGNLLVFFLGWESVGVASYLLINFWFTRVQANKAALKALFVNRIGDVALMVAIALILIKYKSIDIILLENLLPYLSATLDDQNPIITLFLFIAVAGKSAQLGIHTWLPDAMEGPTPVSA